MIYYIIGVIMKKVFLVLILCIFLQGCRNNKITKEMAYEGVNNYCHEEYDWSISKDNPDIMYVEMGEETDAEYKVIFRSYTGAVVYFYVEKSSGETKIVERVSTLNITNEIGTINILNYLNESNN